MARARSPATASTTSIAASSNCSRIPASVNRKPPTPNHGGVARSGRSGARAYGSVLGDEAVSRRGRDQAQEGEQRVPDQAGTIKETKGEDPYTDTSTGVGGKKVESDQT